MADPVYDDAKKRWSVENVTGTADEPIVVSGDIARNQPGLGA